VNKTKTKKRFAETVKSSLGFQETEPTWEGNQISLQRGHAMVPFSILDLSPVTEGGTVAQSLENSRLLAQEAEAQGYKRFWLAEHHGMRGIASAATSLVIQHVAAGTEKIRVGSGGIMLPNH